MPERKYKTAKELKEKIDEYFNTPIDTGFHSYPGMLLFLDISEDTEMRLRLSKDRKDKDFADVLKKAAARRQEELSRIGLEDRNKSVFAMFLLKQATNGGLRDRPKDDDDGPKEINITINGVGAGEAFK